MSLSRTAALTRIYGAQAFVQGNGGGGCAGHPLRDVHDYMVAFHDAAWLPGCGHIFATRACSGAVAEAAADEAAAAAAAAEAAEVEADEAGKSG